MFFFGSVTICLVLDFNKVIFEFLSVCLSVMKTLSLSLGVFSVNYSRRSRSSWLLPPALCSRTNSLFSIQLSVCVYLFDSQLSLSPLTVLYIMSELVFPQHELV